MKLMVSREWLRDKILADEDVDTDAGAALAILEGLGVTVPAIVTTSDATIADDKVAQLRIALGSLIRNLRFQDELTVSDLAAKAVISEHEIRSIEHDPHYLPKPRTLHQLAAHFKLPARQLMLMSGATRTIDRGFYNEAVRFAARADDLCALNETDTEILYDFVKYMNDREDLK